MADNDKIRQAAIAELARRELAKRESPIAEQTPVEQKPPGLPLQARAAGALYGAGETAAQLASGIFSGPISGLAGIGAGLIPGGRSGAEAVEGVSSALTFQPRTEAGQKISQGLANLFAPIERAADRLGEVSGDPEDALGAAAVKTALLGAPALLGLRAPVRTAATNAITPRPTIPRVPVPTVGELFNKGSAAFGAARMAGGEITQSASARLLSTVEGLSDDIGLRLRFNKTLHPESTAVLKEIKKAVDSGGLSFDDLIELRELAGNAAGSVKPADAFRGRALRDAIDDYVDTLSPDDLPTGSPQAAAQSLNEARDLWSRARKGEEIEKMIQKASDTKNKYTQSGFENALRAEFRKLVRNDKRFRRFNSAEQEAIRKAANGGPVDNALRYLGKLAPTGIVSTGIGSAMSSAIFGPVLGPAGAAVLPVIGLGARSGATAATLRNAERAALIARSGQPIPP